MKYTPKQLKELDIIERKLESVDKAMSRSWKKQNAQLYEKAYSISIKLKSEQEKLRGKFIKENMDW